MTARGPTDRPDDLFSAYFWKKIFTALVFNAITVALVIFTFFASGMVDNSFTNMIWRFQNVAFWFFKPLKLFPEFFVNTALEPALWEEFLYRGPIRIAVGFLAFFGKNSNRWFLLVIWIFGLTLNLHWAVSLHQIHKLIWIPVFTAGTAWLWVVIKTRSLWPAVVCHAAANISIYFLLKIYLFLLTF